MKSIFGIGVLAILLASSCNSSTKSTEKATDAVLLKPLSNDTTAQKLSLFFGFTNETVTDSSKIFIAKSLFGKDTVGIQIEVLKDIEPGINQEGRPIEAGFVKGDIRISSIGAESNNLVKALGILFKLPTDGAMTTTTLVPTIFSSNSGVVDLNSQNTYSFKLFLDEKSTDPAQLFAVLDLYKKAFEISEKDASYRAGVIAAFEGK